MMIVTNPQQFEKTKKAAFASFCKDMVLNQKQQLRKAFDAALLDSTAQAYIDIARNLSFNELAAEMESDLEAERSFITN